MITLQQLTKLESTRNAACEKLRVALAALWPIGSTVSVILNSKQTTPSEGEVVWHSGSEGTITVQLFKKSKWTHRRHVARVHFTRIDNP